MIKDIIVCLSTDGSTHMAGDYAISVGKRVAFAIAADTLASPIQLH
jgi:hypothetical protein